MSRLPVLKEPNNPPRNVTMLDIGLPVAQLSKLAERESWRKEINRPLYHIHKWWATRLGSVFRAMTLAALTPPSTHFWQDFYTRHNLKGKVVLDPFMGSGTTLGEALKLGASAIGCDINPISTFLVRQGLTYISEHVLRTTFNDIERNVAHKIQRLYQTRDPETGELIPVLYFFWVKTLKTPCGDTVPLFSRYVFAQDAYPKNKPKAHLVCPSCWSIISARYDALSVLCPTCNHSFNPQEGPAKGQTVRTKQNSFKIKDLLSSSEFPPSHKMYAMLALRANGEKVYLVPQQEDLDLFQAASDQLMTEDLPLPTMEVRSGHNTNQARSYNYKTWRGFFNERQQLALGILLKEIMTIPDQQIREQFLCLFSSTLEFNNLFCSYKGEGTGAVRHMFSNHILKPERTPLENSVWGTSKSSGTFASLFESRLIKAKRYLDQPFEVLLEPTLFGDSENSTKIVVSSPLHVPIASSWDPSKAEMQTVTVLNGDSARLPLPDNCVDAVITDPPYFDFVHYSELSDFFFAWLAPVLKESYPEFGQYDSSAPGEVQQKDPQLFSKHLGFVFKEAVRVMKEDGILAFTFHHSRPEGWLAIHSALRFAGLKVVATYPVHGEMRTASPKSATVEPISLDMILVCRAHDPCLGKKIDILSVAAKAHQHVVTLKEAGIACSMRDCFVIASAILLAEAPINAQPSAIENCLRELDIRYMSPGKGIN